MSDTFDHEGDAWEDYERRGAEDSGYGHRRATAPFNYDSLYYHTKVKFRCLSATTERAVQLELEDGRLAWVPRSVCRRWGDGEVWVHRATWMNSLKNAKKPDYTALKAGVDIPLVAPEQLEDLLDDETRPF